MSRVSLDINEVINGIVRERVNVLLLKSFEELSKLPSQSSEHLIVMGKEVVLSVWHDALESHDHRIVVQAYKHWKLGVGRMYADGFVVNSRDEKRQLSIEEWAPFS